MKMKRLYLILAFFTGFHWIWSQNANDTLRAYANEGWKHYKEAEYAIAEKNWRQALQYGKNDTVQYDLAQSILQQNRPNEALKVFSEAAHFSRNDSVKAKAWHNIGNIYFHKKQYQKALEAYKNALRANPDDEQTRYNYALTKKLLEKQRKQNKNKNKNKNKNNRNNKNNKNNNNKNNKDNKQNKNQKNNNNNNNRQNKKDDKNKNQSKNQQNKNQNKNQKDKQNQRDKQNQNKDKQNRDQNKQDRRQKGQQPRNNEQNRQGQQKSRLSPAEAKRLLQALKNKEEQTLKKVKARKVGGRKTRTDKDW